MTEQAKLREPDAVALTERVRGEAERTWASLVEAYDLEAWAALGYASWDDYVTGEFDPAGSAAHRLLQPARVGLGIDDAEPSEVQLSESEARDLVGQVVLSLEALTMGLDLVDLATLPKDPQAAAVVAEAIATFTRLRDALQPEGRSDA
ncbi:MAG: hypothetical protein ACR2MO_13755 [Acidimicrobiales bacterium]